MSKAQLDISEIEKIIHDVASEREIISIYDGGDKYLVSTRPKNMNEGDINTDPFYTVIKAKKRAVPCDPIGQMKWFLEAKKHKIYG